MFTKGVYIDIAALINLIPHLQELFNNWKSGVQQRTEQDKEAFDALCKAISETRIYVATLERPVFAKRDPDATPAMRRSEEAEAKLSRLWTAVAVQLRPVDRDLAARCLMKGDYWADPDAWSTSAIRRARIGLNMMFKDAQELL